MRQQQLAVTRALALVRQQGIIETDPVDFVEFLLKGVGSRDLDALADDIVEFVLRLDDVRHHVRERLDVQLVCRQAAASDAPLAETRLAAETIVAAIRAIVSGRLEGRP